MTHTNDAAAGRRDRDGEGSSSATTIRIVETYVSADGSVLGFQGHPEFTSDAFAKVMQQCKKRGLKVNGEEGWEVAERVLVDGVEVYKFPVMPSGPTGEGTAAIEGADGHAPVAAGSGGGWMGRVLREFLFGSSHLAQESSGSHLAQDGSRVGSRHEA